jgi:ubiquinone/menaquinone biosynthesis C-methylase UbiE
MATVMSNLGFSGMSLFFKLRDLVAPRREILEEAGLTLGDHVLDYGCGPGGYVADTADIVGDLGGVYALDIHPLAVARVKNLAARHGLTNVKTIRSDCRTGLPHESVDVVLMYDVFHSLGKPQAVLAEMHRILKPDGILSFSDHHMSEEDIVAGVTDCGLFALVEKGAKTYTFMPRRAWETASNE